MYIINMETTNNKNLATFTHLSTLTQYCIPFGNYIFPLLLWSTTKDRSELIDHNGKQVLNFQLSILLYSLVLAIIAIPIIVVTVFSNLSMHEIINNENFDTNTLRFENITGIIMVPVIAILLFILLKAAEFFLIIYASVKTSHGEYFDYPLTFKFIK
jgi:uncharacterized Tic20 family protein